MIGGGERAHVGADLGNQGVGDVVADAWHCLQSLDGAAKGGERGLQPRIEFRDRRFDLFDRLPMLTDQELMMVAQMSLQRRGEYLARASSLEWPSSARRRGSVSPVTIAFRMRRPLRPRDRGQLDVGLFQRRLNPLGMTDELARQLASRARKITQFLGRLWRHETGSDQAMGQKFGDPRRVVGIALASRHVANVRDRRGPGGALSDFGHRVGQPGEPLELARFSPRTAKARTVRCRVCGLGRRAGLKAAIHEVLSQAV